MAIDAFAAAEVEYDDEDIALLVTGPPGEKGERGEPGQPVCTLVFILFYSLNP